MSAPQQDGVFITAREVYDKIVAIELAVTGLPQRVEKLEAAVEGLKLKVALQTGGAAVVGSIIGVFAGRVFG